MRKLIYVGVITLTTAIMSCSIDKMDIVDVLTISTDYVESNNEHPEGGYYVYFFTNEVLTETVFLSNGTDGVDGQNGIDGIDGINGEDGASVTISTEDVEGGTLLTITQGDSVTSVFIEDGVDGTNGLDGLNGTNGTDGVDGTDGIDGMSVTVTSEVVDGGTNLTIIDGNGDVTVVFIADGVNGIDGTDGTNGQDGEDLTNGDGTVTICHRVTHPVADHPEWGSNTNVTLTLTLSEYVHHVYEYHNGNSTQNDAWGACE